jgi:hypothetical protein
MENSIQTERQQREERQIQDTYNDDYWLKKYGVSADELKETEDIGLSARIIQVNIKNNSFHN